MPTPFLYYNGQTPASPDFTLTSWTGHPPIPRRLAYSKLGPTSRTSPGLCAIKFWGLLLMGTKEPRAL